MVNIDCQCVTSVVVIILLVVFSPGFTPVSDPLGARTQDPNIKSVVLYQLS